MRKGLLILVSASLIGGCAPSFEPNSSLQRRLQPARHGDPRGLYKLGYAYEQGQGVKADPVRALMWYSLASEQGYEQAAARIERVGGQLDPEQRAQAEALAADWRRDSGTP